MGKSRFRAPAGSHNSILSMLGTRRGRKSAATVGCPAQPKWVQYDDSNMASASSDSKAAPEPGKRNYLSQPKREDVTGKAWMVMMISLPDFSPGNVKCFPATQIAPVGISDPIFSSLWYVPILRTFLLCKCFLFGVSGAEAPG
jgi:hypothetical protein